MCRYSKDKFVDNLNKVDWSLADNMSVNEKADYIIANIKESISEFIKPVKTNKNNKVWYTSELREKRKLRDETYAKAVFNDQESDWDKHKKVRNSYTFDIKNKRSEYYYKKTTKCWW